MPPAGFEPAISADEHIEVVRRYKYLGTVINDTNDETEKIRARILAANKAYSHYKLYLDPKKSIEQESKTIQNTN
jgi:hypothetical protein